MKYIKSIVSVLIVLIMTTGLFGCVVSVPPAEPMTSADEAEAMGFYKDSDVSTVSVGDFVFLSVSIRDTYTGYVNWKSANPEIATVDSNGRVDGIKEGKTVITAKALSAEIEFPMTVTKAKSQSLSNSTATYAGDTNLAILESNKQSGSDLNLYSILVNLTEHSVTAYTYDSNERYTVPVRKMVCATETGDRLIIKRDYYVGEKDRWAKSDEGKYHQYSSTFSDEEDSGLFRFCSAPYNSKKEDSLVTDSYNKIGTACTTGDVWLAVSDAKWLYDNCNESTHVRVYRDVYVPLTVPTPLKLTDQSLNKNWDPTDTAEKNPYRNHKPTFTGVEDTTLHIGETFSPIAEVNAYDTCGALVKSGIKVEGTVRTDKAGKYVLTYYYTDILNRTGRADRVVTVQ